MRKSPFATSTLTTMARASGKIGLNCGHCGLSFETYACWAKRKKNHYCGKACSDAAKVRRVKVNCVVCGAEFEGIPSSVLVTESGPASIVTCSRKCLKKKRHDIVKTWLADVEKSSFFNYGLPLKGEKIGASKLTADQVEAIRADTRVQRVIAEEYGVAQTLISQIKLRKIWAHLEVAK